MELDDCPFGPFGPWANEGSLAAPGEGGRAPGVPQRSPATLCVVVDDGTKLIEGTLKLVRSRGLKVIPRCDFVRAYIAKHPEYRDLLA